MERNINSKIYIENVEKGYFVDQPILPNSIPSIKGFVGREDYLKELRESYQNGSRCFVMYGIGGVGKTAMALQFASEIAGEYEAKIRVDMQGMSKNPLSARDAMLAVVREFERDIAADIPEAQLKNLYVSKVQNQPTLIVLDNAANMEAVESLNQTEACLIVTSRQSFVLTNGKSKQIAKMSPEDARELLCKNGGEERFEGRADELAELAGYLPMVLKPLAALLAEDELETAANLIERYRNKQELLKKRVPDYENLTIEASFELSYEALSDEMKERWRRLSVFPADFDEAAIAAILDVPQVEAKNTQKQLRRFSLLEVNTETKRFNLHDLIRVFTDAKLSDDERFQIHFSHAKHYASALICTDEMRLNLEENYYVNALKIIDVEWENITSAQRWTAVFSEKDNSVANLCADYSAYGRWFLILRLHPLENINWLESGLKAARKLNNRQDEANKLGNLANAYFCLNEYPKAIDYNEKCLEISIKIGNRHGAGNCLGNLGAIYNNLGEYRKAVANHEQHLIIACEIGDLLGKGRSLNSLGDTYFGLGEYQKSIEYNEQSLIIAREIGDRLGEGAGLNHLGLAYFGLGDYRKAIEYYEQYLVIAREIGDRKGEGASLGNLGNSYSKLGNYKKTIEYHEQALAISREIGSRLNESNSLDSLGSAYDGLGESRKAINCYEQALAISQEISDRLGEGISLGNLGSSYFRLWQKEIACGLWKQAVTILESIESPNANIYRVNIENFCGN